ncbi:MAG: CHASE3 domain-containing protein [Nitrospiraceae bacterium]|nr:CHASE3 domain-containing protein [Nitrospiraceae bacterium]
MGSSVRTWWQQRTVQHKVWAVLSLLLIPLLLSLAVHFYVTSQLLAIQKERQSVLQAREYIHVIHRLAIDGEDALHGYVLTQDQEYLPALERAESELDGVLRDILSEEISRTTAAVELYPLVPRLKTVLTSMRELIDLVRSAGHGAVLSRLNAAHGHVLSDGLRKELRSIEDRLDVVRRSLNTQAERLSSGTFVELWCAFAVFILLSLVGSRLLTRSITDRITGLQAAATDFGRQIDPARFRSILPPAGMATDELGALARAYDEMAVRISTQIKELETLEGIGEDINTIAPDGLDGVLRRITNHAAELADADVSLVMLRNDKMGCWVVEAASGSWNEGLYKAVMLWEQFPVSVQAYDTRQVAYGVNLHRDCGPEVMRRNLLGSSMMSVPLLSQGRPFGVLVVVSRHRREPEHWNSRLAVGLAQQAAVAISNARLYEAVQERQQGLAARLRHLEHLAAALAHDLKGPGQRMAELTALIHRECHGRLDERVDRWLRLLRENGCELVERVEGILAVAHVGAGAGPVTAVDPALVLGEVVKERATELERQQGRITVEPDLPLVACHAAYLRQIFDNVVSNALKYASPKRPVRIRISAQRRERMACFSVQDNGIGIPEPHRMRVFQPFVRLGSADVPGSGIGLTIVQRIVELYGGEIWIEGEDEEGCTVRFTLPWFE